VLEQIKSFIRDTLGMPPSVTLLAIGSAAHLALNALLRKPPGSPWGLWAPLILGLAIESWEIRATYHAIGLTAPGNDPLVIILMRHGFDVGLMLAGPLLLVGIVWLRSHR